MDDWILQVQPGQRVLDLGSGMGSFPLEWFNSMVVLLDEDPGAFRGDLLTPAVPAGPYCRVLALCGVLPFADDSFDLVICNHSLEHLTDAGAALHEVARILKPTGRLFVSVPDGYGFCDGLYRWLFEGGGHVNRFHREQLVREIEGTVGLGLVRWSTLYSSFSYLRNLAELLRDPPAGLAGRLLRFRRPPFNRLEWAQVALYHLTRFSDRLLGTELAVYGWALCFDRSGEACVEQPGFWNVCLYCGNGQRVTGPQMRSRRRYACNKCFRANPYQRPARGTASTSMFRP